jgi:hypothetical protein
MTRLLPLTVSLSSPLTHTLLVLPHMCHCLYSSLLLLWHLLRGCLMVVVVVLQLHVLLHVLWLMLLHLLLLLQLRCKMLLVLVVWLLRLLLFWPENWLGLQWHLQMHCLRRIANCYTYAWYRTLLLYSCHAMRLLLLLMLFMLSHCLPVPS